MRVVALHARPRAVALGRGEVRNRFGLEAVRVCGEACRESSKAGSVRKRAAGSRPGPLSVGRVAASNVLRSFSVRIDAACGVGSALGVGGIAGGDAVVSLGVGVVARSGVVEILGAGESAGNYRAARDAPPAARGGSDHLFAG